MKYVWVFSGSGNSFPLAVYTELPKAKEWITKNKLSGLLAKYPLNISIYNWSIEEGFFNPKKEEQLKPLFIQKYSSASQESIHFEGGIER